MLQTMDARDIGAIKEKLKGRTNENRPKEQKIVDEIIRNVRERGDEALFEYIRKFDGYEVNEDNLAVAQEEIDAAYEAVDSSLIDVMKEAAVNIERFHNQQKRQDWFMEVGEKVLGQLYLPVERAGVYVPGGKSPYPSSVLMNIVPAKCAGVENIFVATPATDGKVNPAILVAASIAGAHKILKMGGAQAIAAFAYGTRSVPAVDKITGPGNIYVALAKRSVYGQVGIDMIAGPSEVLVIADGGANPAFVAADLLSQAEHDEMAACMLVTSSAELLEQVNGQIAEQVEKLGKREIAQKSLDTYGMAVVTDSLEQAAEVANQIAPEHLEICTAEPKALLALIRNAGSIFLGDYTPEPLGDYFAGANHVIPTNGTARFSSPLNVDDFQKKSSVLYYSKEEFERVYKKVERFALSEGFEAHARSATIRFEG